MTSIAQVRATIQQLDDDQIRGVIHALVHGLIHGMLDDIVARADAIVDDVTGSILDQLAEAARAVSSDEQMTPDPAANDRVVAQDSATHTCEICGRVGTRRYVPVGRIEGNRWRCSPTATACPGNRKPLPSDIPAKTIPANVTPPAPKPVPAPPTLQPKLPTSPPPVHAPGVTARCQDCSRAWTLTGRVLEAAVAMHEQKHGHIVDIIGERT